GDDPEAFTNRKQGVLRMRKAKEDIGGMEGSVEGIPDAEPDAGDGRSARRDAEVNEEELSRQQEEGPEDKATQERSLETVECWAGTLLEAAAVTSAQSEAGPAREKQEETHLQIDAAAEEELPAPPHAQAPVQLRRRDQLKPEDPQQKAHRSSHDFPDTLYELLCALQEGRRLNDQRCSFQLQGRRRCHSEPATPRHSQKVVFSSVTSLQREEFFELVATSQGRRLDDQRAEFHSLPLVPRRRSSASKAKVRKGSCKTPAAPQTAPTPPHKEELYNMIVISQAQGRLEEQRSAAPGPMDDEDFFSLLLKVQGGRMDEQRTELPVALKY
ncbi:hypothetical protein P4O66_004875, partial [Electrophorus voltai]